MALPFLETLASKEDLKAKAPKRLVFLGGGYGLTEESFYPKKHGKFSDIGITPGLKNMERHINELTMVQGLFNPKVRDPHSGSSGYLAGIKNAISCDSNAANGKPIAGIKRPIDLYHQLFASGKQSSKEINKMLAKKRSILDAVSQNGLSMKKRLSTDDKDKVEEYFESVRDIEINLQRQAEWATVPKPKAPFKGPDQGISGEEEIQAMLDMIIIALQTDSTRVASYRLPITSLLKSLDIGITAHALSHYKFSKTKRADSETRDARLMKFIAEFVDKLKVTKDRNGLNLYDTTLTSFGGNLRTAHTLHSCPALIIGGSNKFKKGYNIQLKNNTPMTNYWLTILQDAGVNISQFNDSTGELTDMLA